MAGERGDTAALVVEGVESAGEERRAGTVRRSSTSSRRRAPRCDRGDRGDLVVVCVDHANQVWKELQRRQHGAATETDGLRALVGVVDGEDDLDLEL